MKTLFMILVMGFAFSTPNESVVETTEATTVGLSEEVNFGEARRTNGYVVFGRKRRNCRGFGICRASITTVDTDEGTRTTFGIDGNKIVYLHWKWKPAKSSSQAKNFDNGVLVLEEDVKETLIMKGEKFILQLRAGEHKLRKDEDGFLLEVSG